MKFTECDNCKGQGVVRVKYCLLMNGQVMEDTDICPECEGLGFTACDQSDSCDRDCQLNKKEDSK